METINLQKTKTFDRLVEIIKELENFEVYGNAKETLEINHKKITHETYIGYCSKTEEDKFKMGEICELGYDSLESYELCCSIEKNFEIDIPDEKAIEFKQVKDYVNWIENNS